MRLLNQLIFGCGLLTLGFLSNPALAKDYQHYSLDLGNSWVEMLPEQDDGSGSYLLNLLNEKTSTMLMITSADAEQELDAETLQEVAKTIVKEMQQKGMGISKQGFNEEEGYYYTQGILTKMPYKMRIFTKDEVLFVVISAGKNIDDGLKMIDKIQPH